MLIKGVAKPVAQMLKMPFDRLRVNGVYIEIITFSVLLSLTKHEPFLRLRLGHSEKIVRPEVLEG